MTSTTTGIHHVTAIAGEPQRNVDFYAGLLGLRMVKKTVNFDDPETYHLYYGNGDARPGSIMTFFPWAGASGGRQGRGQVSATSFAVPEEALGFWTERLIDGGVRFEKPFERFGETVVSFSDPDGLRLEIVAASGDGREPWTDGPVSAEYAVRGFGDVALSEERPGRTAELLSGTLGFVQVAEDDGRTRFEAGDGGLGNRVDIVSADEPRGRMGVGTVHHVAFRVPDDETQVALREEIAGLGYDVTPVLDRQYFHSIYFREPGGVLFEIATDPPGFTTDEDPDHLGEDLKLPPWLESRRSRIEEALPALDLPSGKNR